MFYNFNEQIVSERNCYEIISSPSFENYDKAYEEVFHVKPNLNEKEVNREIIPKYDDDQFKNAFNEVFRIQDQVVVLDEEIPEAKISEYKKGQGFGEIKEKEIQIPLSDEFQKTYSDKGVKEGLELFEKEPNNPKTKNKLKHSESSINIVINNPQISGKFQVFKGEFRKEKKKRKYKPDDIRKKIKARFHKTIKNVINENLKKAGSNILFDFLPQIFVSSISRDKNREVLNLTFRQIIEKDFISEIDETKYKNKKVDQSKYKQNLATLAYLDRNPEIYRKSGFDIIGDMKYSELLNEYFISQEFDKSIDKLREENEPEDYINEYKAKAKDYVNFFSKKPPVKTADICSENAGLTFEEEESQE